MDYFLLLAVLIVGVGIGNVWGYSRGYRNALKWSMEEIKKTFENL